MYGLEAMTVVDVVDVIGFIPGKDITPEYMVDKCAQAVADGYEGLILRSSRDIIQRKRTKNILKYKTFWDMEALIVAPVEGKGKLVGMLGALLCEVDGKGFEVGSGFSDDERKKIWQNILNK
jgi:DNA ligase-1